MKHGHVRPQQNGWTVLSVEVCCSRIGEGFGSVGFQFGAGVRPGNRLAGGEVGSSGRQNPPWPPPRIAAQSETDLARFIQVSSPRGPVVGTGGGQSRAASQEWRASPSGTGWGWRFAAGRRRVGRAQRRQGRMVAARTATGKGVLQVGPLVLVVSILCKNELSRGLKGCCLLPLTRKSQKVPGFLFRVENDAGARFISRRFGVPLLWAVISDFQGVGCWAPRIAG